MTKRHFSLLLAAMLSAPLMAAEENAATHHAHWSYTADTGSKHWAEIQPDYIACKLGKEQSPIDIHVAGKGNLPAIDFAYQASPAEVVNNGHTIQVNLAAAGSAKLASGDYHLLQFHFHTPSEERIRGKAYPLVAHMVHRDDAGNLAVVAVLFKLGKENPGLAKIFATMPAEVDGKSALPENFNPADLLPARQGYYAYMGSLTTPPCSENVHWQVLKQAVELSKGQLAAFQKLYPMNARPVQPLNGRKVEQR